MTFKLGLTGSIGMGKSTTARMFAEAGCAVWDADAAVRRLYDRGGMAVQIVSKKYPNVVVDGVIDRAVLREEITRDPKTLSWLESVVHPLVREDRTHFMESVQSEIAVFDIPLLFETGSEAEMDAIVCVTVSAEEQEKRVLERGTMTREQFLAIRDKQMPNSEKIARSDFVIETDTLEHARAGVHHVVAEVKKRLANA